jgi:hypothetical protein
VCIEVGGDMQQARGPANILKNGGTRKICVQLSLSQKPDKCPA